MLLFVKSGLHGWRYEYSLGTYTGVGSAERCAVHQSCAYSM